MWGSNAGRFLRTDNRMSKFLSDIPEVDGYVYLCSPYSSDLALVESTRYAFIRSAVAYMATFGITALSPVVYSHEIAHHHNLMGGEFWQTWAIPLLKSCCEGWVLMISGWQESEGVRKEIELLRVLDKPIKYVYFNSDWTDIMMVENDEHFISR